MLVTGIDKVLIQSEGPLPPPNLKCGKPYSCECVKVKSSCCKEHVLFYFCHQNNGLSPSQAPGVMLPGKARAPASVPFHMKSQNILCVQPELWGKDWPGRGTDLMEDLGAAPAGSLPLALLPASLLPAPDLDCQISAPTSPLFLPSALCRERRSHLLHVCPQNPSLGSGKLPCHAVSFLP